MAGANLHPDLEAGVHELRGALIDLFSRVGADVRRPQELSRQLKLDKSLAWKISRVTSAGGAQEALQHMPGDAALALVVNAVAKAGAPPEGCQRLKDAITEFKSSIEKHVGDKPTLELVIDAFPTGKGDRLSVSRKLAFRGNSGIFGVQARARMNTICLAPNPEEPDLVDMADIGGWLSFRRLRHDARWMLFKRSQYSTHGSLPREQAIDPNAPKDGSCLLTKFCSSTMPPTLTSEEEGSMIFEIGDSSVGNSGAFDCFYGTVIRKIGSRYMRLPTDRGTFRSSVSAPVEELQVDFLIHKSLGFALNQSVQTVSKTLPPDQDVKPRDVLPIVATRIELGREPPIVHSPLMPRYGEMLDFLAGQLGWDWRDFVGIRYVMEYPPYPSMLDVNFPLDPPKA